MFRVTSFFYSSAWEESMWSVVVSSYQRVFISDTGQRKLSRESTSKFAKNLVICSQRLMQSFRKCMERSVWAGHEYTSDSNVSKIANKVSKVMHVLGDFQLTNGHAAVWKDLQIIMYKLSEDVNIIISDNRLNCNSSVYYHWWFG